MRKRWHKFHFNQYSILECFKRCQNTHTSYNCAPSTCNIAFEIIKYIQFIYQQNCSFWSLFDNPASGWPFGYIF